MIHFSGHSETGRRFIGLGLSEENLRRLKDGQPIFVELTSHGLEADALIFYGRTEDEMEAMVKRDFTFAIPQ